MAYADQFPPNKPTPEMLLAAEHVSKILNNLKLEFKLSFSEWGDSFFKFHLNGNPYFPKRNIYIENDAEIILVLTEDKRIYIEIELEELELALLDSNEGKIYDYRFCVDKSEV